MGGQPRTHMHDISDEALVALIKKGDSEKFGVLIERYKEKLIRYARRFMSDSDMATDAVQDVFIKAYINIQSFDTSKKFSSWIYRIAHNEYVNLLRKKKMLSVSFFDFDTFFPHHVVSESAEALAIKEEEKVYMEKVLAQLDIKYREPLILYFFEDMKYEEIAEILHIPVATVGVRIMRAKQQLKNSI